MAYFTARHSRNIEDKKIMELMVGSKHLNSKRFRSKYVIENRHILTLVYNIRACLYEESQPGYRWPALPDRFGLCLVSA